MSEKQKHTYPEKLSILRFFRDAEGVRRNPIPFHKKYFDKLGDSFSIRIGFSKYIILSRDNEIAQYILVKNQKNYHKSKFQSVYLSKYLGKGLLTSDGDFWLKQRRLIQPAFHKQKMNQLVDNMNAVIALELENLIEEKPIDLFPVMSNLAFNVVAKSLFQLSTAENKFQRIKFIIEEVQNFLIKEIRLPHKAWWFSLSGQVKKHLKLAEENNHIIQEIIEERKASGEEINDLLNMLLETRYEDTGESMSVEQLIDEIKVLFIAGHETTANALTFTLHLLGRNPEVQQKIFEEIIEIESQTDNVIEQLQKMTYTNAVLNESMRLYPPAWITDRQNLEDDSLAHFKIKKNTLIGVSFYELHRNPKYWKNPDEFIPERFLGDQKKESMQYFYPFGAGPRMCIGTGFAIYEMCLTIAQVVKKYIIKSNNDVIQFNPLITLKPVNVEVSFFKR
ncbi:cytochrome P450 [Flavobacterium johnsoniae]|uniref:Cytochrome P450 n=1 Tax=Flavobacterium johnsoniae (strain ATCC 17061 / DSM 2064 / JCM 8514 / BCRC 14874 / CCUG 350202 / NBRC 14942 / NCIMB 11054 / UW101) TaxID=376686 RepID=A5FJE6_FLAJ1|nr:cytochrome P450 [Flavobacterium johnsoniae]ABQ04675.1 cytochrome P450 [Flavobacterium johnsoniae UW101]OXE97995.1 cytochrome P450 [Flavobacterium johnsoniae UW101]WQG83528.1 cytochrome P450 [Flavobacterium johnsoniae UW101]SHK30173.1 Cytochrome P450 [Flavobacterium johnsoniae]